MWWLVVCVGDCVLRARKPSSPWWWPALVALGVVLSAASPSRAATPPQGAPPGTAGAGAVTRYVYLTTLTAEKPDAATVALFDRVDTAIMTGLRLATSRERDARRYDEVLSYRRIVAENVQTLKSFNELSRYTTRNLDQELDNARKKIKAKDAPLELLKPVIFRTASGELRVDIERYEPDGMKLVAVKSVGGCGAGEEDVLERLRQAAERLGSVDDDKKPLPVIAADPAGPVKVGTPVVLDGCRSADPDHDAITWTWRQSRTPPDESGNPLVLLPGSGHPGRQLRFVPEVPGRYEIQLEVKQVLGGQSGWTTRVIEVVAPPRAVTGPSRLVEKLDQVVELDGSASTPSSGTGGWRQISGPRVTLGSMDDSGRDGAAGSTGCSSLKCAFKPRETGLYGFELVVRDGPFSDTASVSILVAPRPIVRVGDVRSMEVGSGYSSVLDGSASSDVLDNEPTFLWEVMEPSRGAAVSPRQEARALFFGQGLGNYRVKLRVCARRHLPGQKLWSCNEATATVVVRRDYATLFATLGYQATTGPAPDGYDRVLVPHVGIILQPLNNCTEYFGKCHDRWKAIAVRVAQSVCRLSLAPEGSGGVKAGSARPGGGSTWELGYWPMGPNIAELLPHAGLYIDLEDPRHLGFTAGLTLTLRLWHRFIGLLDVDYSHVWHPGVTRLAPQLETDLLGFRAGLGVRL